MTPRQIYSQEFFTEIIDNLLNVASDFSLLETLESLEGKISPTRLKNEIQKTLRVYGESLEQAKIYLKICERDNYLSSDIIWNYQMKMYKIRDKISEATSRHSEDFSLTFMHLKSLFNVIYGNINSIPIVKEVEYNYLITPENAIEHIKENLEICHISCKIIESHLKRLEKEGCNVKEYYKELILIQITLDSIAQIEGIKR